MEVQYPLVFFTLLLCVASGMFAVQGCLLVARKGSPRFHVTALAVEAVALVVGGFSSFLHLHHWERIFNGFGHLTSGITQELIGVVVLAAGMVVLFVSQRKAQIAAAGAEGGAETAASAARVRALPPVWVGVMAIVIGVAMGFVCAHSYYMESRPAWSNPTLYLYYYASEFVLGATAAWLVAAVTKQDESLLRTLSKVTLAAGLVSAVAVVICGFVYSTLSFNDVGIAFHTTDPTAPAVNPEAVLASPIAGENALLFWGGAVIIGSLVAMACGLVGTRKPAVSLPASAVALACSLVGGVCFRIVLYVVGVAFYVYF